jgi:oligopeptide transport system substrate-binding protein
MTTQAEQSLRINLKKEPISLDPRKGNDMVASQLHYMLFEGLLRLNPDLSLSPAQAKSYTVSPDGKIYTFNLRDTEWSDGTPVTAYDFEKSWKSLLDPVFPCHDAYLLFSVKNARAAKKGEIPLYQVGITSKDAKTLIVELEAPAPYFLQIVASSVLLPVNFQTEAKDPDWAESCKNFISNGPFTLTTWKLNKEISMQKNPRYRDAGEVKLDRVTFEVIDNESTVYYLFSNGHFDLIGAPLSSIPTTVHQDPEKKKLLNFFPVAMTKFLAFNNDKFPFNNANIRRAFAYSIDRKALIDHITQLNQKEALNILPPVLLPKGNCDLFADADNAKAKECFQKGIKELGVEPKDLDGITFMYVGSPINQSIGQELQNHWSKLFGVRIALDNVEFKTLHERSKKGDFSIGVFAWVAEYSDPMNILERFQDKTNHRNYPKWQSDSFNLALDKALKSSSQHEYLQHIKDAEQIMIDDMPIAGLFHDNYAFLIQPYIHGVAISPLGHIYFDKISIDPAHREKVE